ncbi:transcriptional regulator, partial [Salmonella enterica]|nr:transcriptional regulator [Salmonella enterica]EBP4190090.1 transcriptional regulator [Salmonella enterica subsp. enterica]EDR5667032.1 transcriptional regulator [Salmonella enterica subsp. houtenae serovar 50:z4,z23:-]EAR4342352.1 transcriptional regulator [Salmonella enterica]EAU3727697.1 transcriptional regulator [Salmonella enterica]
MEPKSQDWHRADIKSALEKRGITLRELSRQAGLSPDSLRNVFTRSWPRAERIIADALGVTPQEIWPSRYGDMPLKND